MIEEQILQIIGDRIEDERLHFQVIIQDKTLYLYINRDTDEYIDYSQLTDKIKTAIAELEELDLLAVELYSRMLGEVEPDWQRSIALVDIEVVTQDLRAIASEVKQEVAETKSLVEQVQEIKIDASSAIETQPNTDLKAEESITEDFSQYCFTRNKGLLKADIAAPKIEVVKLIATFDKFELPIKRSQLPLLEEYFKNSHEPDLSSLTPEIQTWWTQAIALEADLKENSLFG